MTLRIREGLIVGVAGIAMAAALAGCTAASADPGFTVGLVTNNANGLRNVDGFVEEMAARDLLRRADIILRANDG
jgi:hypothetical protein